MNEILNTNLEQQLEAWTFSKQVFDEENKEKKELTVQDINHNLTKIVLNPSWFTKFTDEQIHEVLEYGKWLDVKNLSYEDLWKLNTNLTLRMPQNHSIAKDYFSVALKDKADNYLIDNKKISEWTQEDSLKKFDEIYLYFTDNTHMAPGPIKQQQLFTEFYLLGLHIGNSNLNAQDRYHKRYSLLSDSVYSI